MATGRGDAGLDADMPWRRVAARPRPRRRYAAETSRGGAAAASQTRHALRYIFNWVQDDDTFVGTPPSLRSPTPGAEAWVRDLVVEDASSDEDAFKAEIRHECRRRAARLRRGLDVDAVLRQLLPAAPNVTADGPHDDPETIMPPLISPPPNVVIDGDPQAVSLGDDADLALPSHLDSDSDESEGSSDVSSGEDAGEWTDGSSDSDSDSDPFEFDPPDLV